VETPYDRLLAKGHDRRNSRALVEEKVDETLSKWEH
jgi:hypothetical protein